VHEICKRVDVRLVSCLNFVGIAITLTWIGLYEQAGLLRSDRLAMTFFGFSLAMFFVPQAVIAMRGLQGFALIRGAEEFTLLRTAAGAFGIALQAVVPVPARSGSRPGAFRSVRRRRSPTSIK